VAKIPELGPGESGQSVADECPVENLREVGIKHDNQEYYFANNSLKL
jgi:hypothetical protein